MSHSTLAVANMIFLMRHVMDCDAHWRQLPVLGNELNMETAADLLSQYGRLSDEVMAPINRLGDEQGARFVDGSVILPEAFGEAYRRIAAQGWLAVGGDVGQGGTVCSRLLLTMIDELNSAANMSLGLYMGLSWAAAETIALHASDALRTQYLPLIYSGRYSGAMCLTESAAGSDLGSLQCRAVPCGGGQYEISGNKIFITGGQHNMTEGILYLVLARVPDAPQGNSGITMFLVPGDQGNVKCLSIESKMGIHGSSTCSLAFEKARGWPVGEINNGLTCMFSMMNTARLTVGMQGLGCAAACFQRSLDYAGQRKQGSLPGSPSLQVPIIKHADVRRMLITQQCLIEGMRALSLEVSRQRDQVDFGTGKQRAAAERQLGLMTPLVKAFFTDMGLECCVLAQQVFGGYGYIRETGIEQYVRDVRIAQIYEGTNGIQARDLLRRKLLRDHGQSFGEFADAVVADLEEGTARYAGDIEDCATAVRRALECTRRAASRLSQLPLAEADACAMDFLHLLGYTALAWMWLRIVVAVLGSDDDSVAMLRDEKMVLAAFYMEQILPRTEALSRAIDNGGGRVSQWGELFDRQGDT